MQAVNFTDAIDLLKSHTLELAPTFLEPAGYFGGSQTWICPICGQGSHGGHGIHYYEVRNHDGRPGFKCYGCDEQLDIIDVIKASRSVSTREAVEIGLSQLGYKLDDGEVKYTKLDTVPAKPALHIVQAPDEIADYTDYYGTCKAASENPAFQAYIASRGFSKETASKYWLGYDAAWQSPTALKHGKNPTPSERVIVPVSKNHYLALPIDRSQPKMHEVGGGHQNWWRKDDLYAGGPVWIVESITDALALKEIDMGINAVAIQSAAQASKLVKVLTETPPMGPIMLAMDNDDAGRASQEKIKAGLKAAKIEVYDVNPRIFCGEKDLNAALTTDRETFTREIERIGEGIKGLLKPEKSLVDYIEDGSQARESQNLRRAGKKRTGMESVDNMTGGGFEMGMSVLIADPGVGKTTLVLQWADFMAEQGHDVIYIALEQGALEISSKSEARYYNLSHEGEEISAQQIRWGEAEAQAKEGARLYAEATKGRVTVLGTDQIQSARQIREYVEKVVRYTGKRPVVVVDYLQLLRAISPDAAYSDKQVVDDNVAILIKMCKDLLVTCIAISSTTKSAHGTSLNIASAKESGSIEYGATFVFSLESAVVISEEFRQAKNAAIKEQMLDEAELETPREMVLRKHKGRSNSKHGDARLLFYAGKEYFVDISGFQSLGSVGKLPVKFPA